jgi:lipopolysaccharide biosynthesis glycosyltransferase
MESTSEKLDFEVWFAVDARTSECGFVAAASLLAHRPVGSLTKICVAYVQGEEPPANWWKKTLLKYKNLSFRQIPIDPNHFKGVKLLYDSIATYLRLAIPLYAQSNVIVYSDADVIYQEDIKNIFHINYENEILGMIQDGCCNNRCDKEKYLLEKYGKMGDDPYFNAGICVINTQEYIRQNIYPKAKELISNYSNYLTVYDQTILNCIINKPRIVESRWNFPAFPQTTKKERIEKRESMTANGILHFVGSPKPWDILAEFYHPYSKIWIDTASKSGLKFPRFRKYCQIYSWKRAWRIRKQYGVWFR